MKYISLLFAYMLMSVIAVAQSYRTTCQLGFTFEISQNPNWGQYEPVVTSVTPGSPAEQAGLEVNDVILEINGNGTYLKPAETLLAWFDMDSHRVNIGIRNFTATFKSLSFDKDCRHPNAIYEPQLAPVFAFYSLEDVQDRTFTMPVTTKSFSDTPFFSYRKFAFMSSNFETEEIDNRINNIFIRAFKEIGLEYDPYNPDFYVQTYYSYESNPLYKHNSPTYGSYQPVWRFDLRHNRMVKVPVYNAAEPVRVDDIMYQLEFGYRLYDARLANEKEASLVWESEVRERVSGNYGLLDYLELNLPLMLRKFPYPGKTNSATFQLNYIKYNYTGIGFDMNDLKTVVDVRSGSPAQRAGILPGDVITRIQDKAVRHRNATSLTQDYRRFMAETMDFRDTSTRYTDGNGFRNAMLWNVSDYGKVYEAISDNRRYNTIFSYLFNFNQYVDWYTPSTISVEVRRDRQRLNFELQPEVRLSSHLRVR